MKKLSFIAPIMALATGCSGQIQIESKPTESIYKSSPPVEFRHLDNKNLPNQTIYLTATLIPDIGQTIVINNVRYMVVSKETVYDGVASKIIITVSDWPPTVVK